MNKKLIKNVRIINEGRSYQGAVLINGEMIEAVYEGEVPSEIIAEAKEVKKGLRTEAEVQIIEGLSIGDTLITSGVMQLRDGTPVTLDMIEQ